MYIPRNIVPLLKNRLQKFPVLSLTGPRQSGKTTLLKKEFTNFRYMNLERMDHREMILSDPVGFLKSAGPKVIFDEAQKIPELFSYIQVISDERGTAGQYILSGSESFLMNEHISQSLAGRAHISHLLPFDTMELSSEPSPLSKQFSRDSIPVCMIPEWNQPNSILRIFKPMLKEMYDH